MVSAIMAVANKSDFVEAGKFWDCLRTAKTSRNNYQHSGSISREEALDTYVSLWSKFSKKPQNL